MTAEKSVESAFQTRIENTINLQEHIEEDENIVAEEEAEADGIIMIRETQIIGKVTTTPIFIVVIVKSMVILNVIARK